MRESIASSESKELACKLSNRPDQMRIAGINDLHRHRKRKSENEPKRG